MQRPPAFLLRLALALVVFAPRALAQYRGGGYGQQPADSGGGSGGDNNGGDNNGGGNNGGGNNGDADNDNQGRRGVEIGQRPQPPGEDEPEKSEDLGPPKAKIEVDSPESAVKPQAEIGAPRRVRKPAKRAAKSAKKGGKKKPALVAAAPASKPLAIPGAPAPPPPPAVPLTPVQPENP